MSQKNSKISKRTHKIIFLGDSGVGKTCIIEKFASNRFDDFFNVRLILLSLPSEWILLAKILNIKEGFAGFNFGTLQGNKSSRA